MMEALPFSSVDNAFHILLGGVLKRRGLLVEKISGLGLHNERVVRLRADKLTFNSISSSSRAAASLALISAF